MSRLLVLDFDGTMTDAEVEGVPFRLGYLEDVSLLCGLRLEEVLTLAEAFEVEVDDNAHAYGWDFEGRIVAPASVDPYLRMMPVARMIFDHTQTLMDPRDRNRLLGAVLYKYNYQKTQDAFRPGALDVLQSLKATPLRVVTQSPTDLVREKLRRFGARADGSCALDWLLPRVHGSVKKYQLDDTFTDVPEAMTLPGLARPVWLRRVDYHRMLAALLHDEGCGWDDLVVVGDIFELDLSLPLALGARVGLLANAFTPEYEMAFLADHPRGVVLTEVGQIPEFAFGSAV